MGFTDHHLVLNCRRELLVNCLDMFWRILENTQGTYLSLIKFDAISRLSFIDNNQQLSHNIKILVYNYFSLFCVCHRMFWTIKRYPSISHIIKPNSVGSTSRYQQTPTTISLSSFKNVILLTTKNLTFFQHSGFVSFSCFCLN